MENIIKHLARHGLDYSLSVLILCLAGMIAHRHLGGAASETSAIVSVPEDDIGAMENADSATKPVAATAVSYGRRVGYPVSLRGDGMLSRPLRYRPAVRLVELGDAVLVSLAVRDIETNAVQIALAGSTLKILTHHVREDQTTTVMENSIMLPVAVDASAAPTYHLQGDLLQVRVSKAIASNK